MKDAIATVQDQSRGRNAEGATVPFRLIRPDRRTRWAIGDLKLEVTTWTDEEWRRLPVQDRPNTAQELPGIGWQAMRQVR